MKANGSFLGNRAWHQILNLATGLAIVLAGAQGTAFAQGKGRSPQKVVADTGSAKNARSHGGGQQEAVKVHGDWTITIRNADRSVASRHEFENALIAPGLLAKLLAHGGTAVDWRVVILGGVCPEPATGVPSDCFIFETGTVIPAFAAISANLVVTAPTAGPHANALVLEGSIKASLAGRISLVSTAMAICSPGSPIVNCQSLTGGGGFTEKDLSSLNINVQPGQTIDVKVVISFS